MNNSQNENKPLTAEGILDDLYKRVFANIDDDMAWGSALLEIEKYATQQVKQVTEERNKAVELLNKIRFSESWSFTESALHETDKFINSLNASRSDTGKK